MKEQSVTSLPQAFSLQDRVALVTGATGHLGREMVTALAMAGAHVIINSRSDEKLREFAEQLKAAGIEVTICQLDITDKACVTAKIPALLSRFGKLDILVNNAYAGLPGELQKATHEDFSNAYDIAVSSAFHLIKTCFPFMDKSALSKRSSTSSIINITSMYAGVSPDPAIYGDSGFNNPPYYGAAKAGLLQLTRYLACHYAKQGIRVNTISPGPFPPESIKTDQPDFYQKLCAKVPMNRIGAAYEIQGPLLFLASDASSFVTGSDLKVDGGWTAW